ncbi:MAG: hypothetical protein ACE37B_11025 [Ilumatobacter sp.]|uniref:hypothetical protein n=1 Tax=Ilumatobacter sp. TaxID=1967498 RepID=UPI00391C278F
MHDSVTTQLERHFELLTRHQAQKRLLARWGNDPTLAGRTPTAILDLCEQCTIDQNPVVAALLTRHQAGDPDAGTVLLTAMRPMIKRVITLRHHTALNRDMLDNYWSAASHLIGSVDPAVRPVRRDGEPTPFLSYLGDRVYTHLRKLDPAGRRFEDRKREDKLIVPVDTSQHDHDYVHPSNRTSASSVEDAAIARVELDRVRDAVDNGAIAADRWQRLIEHRLGVAPAARTAKDRVAIHRTACQLAGIVGHAA